MFHQNERKLYRYILYHLNKIIIISLKYTAKTKCKQIHENRFQCCRNSGNIKFREWNNIVKSWCFVMKVFFLPISDFTVSLTHNTLKVKTPWGNRKFWNRHCNSDVKHLFDKTYFFEIQNKHVFTYTAKFYRVPWEVTLS